MADLALIELLSSGFKTWNAARANREMTMEPDLSGADLRDVRLVAFDLSGANLLGSLLAGGELTSAVLDRATLDDADLTDAKLAGVKARGASFRGAVLRNADLRDANFEGADLLDADFTGARLDKCRLVRARLDGALFDGNLANALVDDPAEMFASLPSDRPLEIRFRVDVDSGQEDWPRVTILVEGRDLFGLDGSIGFDPDDLFAKSEPLIPSNPSRRIAVYRCSCGEAGCGCVAPLVMRVGEEVHWSDFRNFVGVYSRPETSFSPEGGSTLPIPTLRFDSAQYEAEVERASEDRSWESFGRKVSRRFKEQFDTQVLAKDFPNYRFQWIGPRNNGWDVSFVIAEPQLEWPRQLIVWLSARTGEPDVVAAELVQDLQQQLSTQL